MPTYGDPETPTSLVSATGGPNPSVAAAMEESVEYQDGTVVGFFVYFNGRPQQTAINEPTVSASARILKRG